jgi:hypothetical protein
MNPSKLIGGRESKDVDQEYVHVYLLNRAQVTVLAPQASLKLRVEALSILLGAFVERGEC